MYTCARVRRGLKEQGNLARNDHLERPANGHGALRSRETTWPTAIHARHDSSLLFDLALKEIRT